MSLTRANVESELVSRQQARMEAVDMDVTVAGSNPDLNNVIGFAIRRLGGSVASFSAVADTDLSSFEEKDYDELLDVAEYRLLLNIKGAWGKVDIQAGQLRENLSQFSKDLDADIAAKAAYLREVYGFGGSSLGAGAVDWDFAETQEDAE